MTLLVCSVTREAALLACDTRVVHRAAGRVVAIRDDQESKIQEAGPWLLASCPSETWARAQYPALGQGGDLRAGIRRWAPGALAQLEARDAYHARRVRDHQVTFAIRHGPRGLERLALDWRGGDRFADVRADETLLLGPSGSDPAIVQRLLDAYERAVRRATALEELQRACVRFFAAVYAHCGPDGTMSPAVHLAAIRRSGDQVLAGPIYHTAAGDGRRLAVSDA